jgi:hypothetical protein
MNTFDHTTEARSASQGLVACDKSDRYAQISVFADLTTCYVPSSAPEHPAGHNYGRRGAITDFTSKSRNNMLRKLAKLRNVSGGFFITLTYPGEYQFTLQESHDHLSALRKRIVRKYPMAGAFWRMEILPRKSGASRGELVPHFHLLLFTHDQSTISDMITWFSRSWYEIVGSENPDHLAAGTNVRLIESKKHAQRYVSKYAAKQSTYAWARIYPGRHWGTFGELDLSCVLVVKIPLARMAEMKRLAAKLLKARGSTFSRRLHRSAPDKGWSVFGLGDSSYDGWHDMFESTVLRMVMAACSGQ